MLDPGGRCNGGVKSPEYDIAIFRISAEHVVERVIRKRRRGVFEVFGAGWGRGNQRVVDVTLHGQTIIGFLRCVPNVSLGTSEPHALCCGREDVSARVGLWQEARSCASVLSANVYRNQSALSLCLTLKEIKEIYGAKGKLTLNDFL